VRSIRLFVYGSLKRGFAHHTLLGDAAREGPAVTAQGYRLVLQGSYPALVPGAGGSVRGEVYRVSAELLARLDAFEGCPELYERHEVALADGTTALCYAIDEERARRCSELDSDEWRT
jgi:gamma-glutamylaminecyclotransferase